MPPHTRDDEKHRLPERHTSLVNVADHASKKSFVFTPFSLFNKTQVMLLRGPTSRAFFRQARLDLSRSYPTDVSVSPTIRSSPSFNAISEESDSEVKEKSMSLFDAKNWMPKLGRNSISDLEKAAEIKSAPVLNEKKPELIGMTSVGLRGQMERRKAAAARQSGPPTSIDTSARPRTAPETPSTPISPSTPPAYSPPRPTTGLRPTTANSAITVPTAARRKSGNMRPGTAESRETASHSSWTQATELDRQEQERRSQASRDARRQVDGYYSRQLNELADGDFFREEVSASSFFSTNSLIARLDVGCVRV